MRSVLLSVAALLVVLQVSSIFISGVEGGKLYPKCGGDNYSLAIGYKHNFPANQVMKLNVIAAAIEIECLAFEVVPPGAGNPLAITTAEGKAQCTREYFESENPFRLYLQAETMGSDGLGSGTKTMWDLDDVLGGSVDKLKYWNNGMSLWSVFFVNKDPKRCHMQLNMMLLAHPLLDRVHVHPSPGLVMIDPPTVYVNRTSLLGFNVIGGPATGDKVRMRPQFNKLRSKAWIALTRQTDAKVLSRHKLYNPAETAAFEFKEPEGGNYIVEYMRDLDGSGNPSTTNVWVAIAHVIVYNGNPAYFRISKGAGPDGQLYIGRSTTFTFSGDKLNTMKNGDEVKFVNFTHECSDSAPDFNNAGSKDLGPGDEASTTQSDWTFTLSDGGSIRVCYKTALSGIWGEVVSYDDLDHLGPATNAPFGSIPVPTHATTHMKCNMAPASSNPTTAKTDILLTLKGGDNFQHSMIVKLADLLCVDPKTIQVLRVGTNNDDQSYVAIDIVCHKYGLHAQCLGTERKDMLLFMWSNQYLQKELQDLGVSAVVSEMRGAEINTIYTYPPGQEPHGPPSAGHAAMVIFFILLILGGVFALGWVFRDKIKGAATAGRGQFMAIGTVDDDDDDDKNNSPHDGDAPTGPTGTVGQRAARSVTRDSASTGDALSERP